MRLSPESHRLRNVYIMTNAVDPWLSKLKQALRSHEHWDSVTSSRDLALTREQKEVSRALDMLIGRRAQIFIGNGVRSIPFYEEWLYSDGVFAVLIFNKQRRDASHG